MQAGLNTLNCGGFCKAAYFKTPDIHTPLIEQTIFCDWLSGLIPKKVSPLDIAHTEQGRPFVKTNPGYYISFSRSRGYCAIAACHEAAIGIDMEVYRDDLDTLAIAQNFFHPEEVHYLSQMDLPEQRQMTFFELWTAKEAVLKAAGKKLNETNLRTATTIKISKQLGIRLTEFNDSQFEMTTLKVKSDRATLIISIAKQLK